MRAQVKSHSQSIPGMISRFLSSFIHFYMLYIAYIYKATLLIINAITGDQMLKQVAAAFFNMVFGNSKGTLNFWDTTLKYKLTEYLLINSNVGFKYL